MVIHFRTSCPFTPFFTEILFQNLRKVLIGFGESIHHCSYPSALGKREERIEQSVARMMTVIDLARNIRERHGKPIKTPLRKMVVVHPNTDFLEDITGKLKEYVIEELNIISVVPCSEPLRYASLRAEPNFSVLGKRLGKAMGIVAKEVKAMSQADILAFESSGEVTFSGHRLRATDIKVLREFKRPVDVKENEIDAAGDGDVLVVLDFRSDDSLIELGLVREVVNKIQKSRKKADLEPTDAVEVYIEPLDDDKHVLERILKSHEQYIREAVGSPLLHQNMMPSNAVVILEEKFHGVSGLSFAISLGRPSLMFNSDAILKLYSGNKKYAENLQTYLSSRDDSNLKSEFNVGKGKISVGCIESQPSVDVILGKHLFLTAGDYHLNRS